MIQCTVGAGQKNVCKEENAVRKGEVQNTVLEGCLDIVLGDVLTDIEASLHKMPRQCLAYSEKRY